MIDISPVSVSSSEHDMTTVHLFMAMCKRLVSVPRNCVNVWIWRSNYTRRKKVTKILTHFYLHVNDKCIRFQTFGLLYIQDVHKIMVGFHCCLSPSGLSDERQNVYGLITRFSNFHFVYRDAAEGIMRAMIWGVWIRNIYLSQTP
jgi:hypothetical protein